MMVLFGLILSLGMLVDNAIVAVENIYRFVERGYKPLDAARRAVGEIAIPIIASTATTLAAFFPLALWHGIMGEFMKFLPITLIIVLTSSLFVALVITPVVSSTFVKAGKAGEFQFKNKKRGYTIAFGMMSLGVLLLFTGWRVFPNLLLVFGFIGVMNLTFFNRMQNWFQNVFLTKLEDFYFSILETKD